MTVKNESKNNQYFMIGKKLKSNINLSIKSNEKQVNEITRSHEILKKRR